MFLSGRWFTNYISYVIICILQYVTLSIPVLEIFTISTVFKHKYYEAMPEAKEQGKIRLSGYKSQTQTGPNHGVSLNIARENYRSFGASRSDVVQYVRKPLPEELPENNV